MAGFVGRPGPEAEVPGALGDRRPKLDPLADGARAGGLAAAAGGDQRARTAGPGAPDPARGPGAATRRAGPALARDDAARAPGPGPVVLHPGHGRPGLRGAAGAASGLPRPAGDAEGRRRAPAAHPAHRAPDGAGVPRRPGGRAALAVGHARAGPAAAADDARSREHGLAPDGGPAGGAALDHAPAAGVLGNLRSEARRV